MFVPLPLAARRLMLRGGVGLGEEPIPRHYEERVVGSADGGPPLCLVRGISIEIPSYLQKPHRVEDGAESHHSTHTEKVWARKSAFSVDRVALHLSTWAPK